MFLIATADPNAWDVYLSWESVGETGEYLLVDNNTGQYIVEWTSATAALHTGLACGTTASYTLYARNACGYAVGEAHTASLPLPACDSSSGGGGGGGSGSSSSSSGNCAIGLYGHGPSGMQNIYEFQLSVTDETIDTVRLEYSLDGVNWETVGDWSVAGGAALIEFAYPATFTYVIRVIGLSGGAEVCRVNFGEFFLEYVV